MATYVWREGHWRDKATGEPMALPDGEIASPTVIGDIPEYASPIDGRMITSRSSRREDLKRSGCVPYEPPPGAPREYRNPRSEARWGIARGKRRA